MRESWNKLFQALMEYSFTFLYYYISTRRYYNIIKYPRIYKVLDLNVFYIVQVRKI